MHANYYERSAIGTSWVNFNLTLDRNMQANRKKPDKIDQQLIIFIRKVNNGIARLKLYETDDRTKKNANCVIDCE